MFIYSDFYSTFKVRFNMSITSKDLITVDYAAPLSASLTLEIPTVAQKEKVMELATQKGQINSSMLYQQVYVKVDRDEDDGPPQFYSVRWWLKYQSYELHRPIDWCHHRKLTPMDYNQLEKK